MSLITPSPKASTSFPLPPPIPPEKKKRKPPAPRYSPRDPNARHGALDPNRTRGQFICEHPGCGKDFTRSDNFKRHQKCHEVYLGMCASPIYQPAFFPFLLLFRNIKGL
ncbi:hypothetical protein FRC19_007541 [Serendipita sp. 401]|nr:hypothetical protein FRC16_008494 [Serendipita sp. 398]KAG8821613.1 hypothetical protein FRC19_007541 [Serendipita sp. 401]